MKRNLFSVLFCWPVMASAQSFVNPDTIQHSGDIYVQNTDVYYNPFAPPGDSDTRENLCNESSMIRDPNGVGNGSYSPMIYDTSVDSFAYLKNWAPYGTRIGPYTPWQRLFQARDKPGGGGHSDIIVGSNVTNDTLHTNGHHGPVIISKNEDVDFCASGTIKMENGFHIKPGAFFHAYQEPTWDTAVFSDEFDDTAKFRNQWDVHRGTMPGFVQCVYDSNVRLWNDTDAHDGHALDIIFRVDSNIYSCYSVVQGDTSCTDSIDVKGGDTLLHHSITSTGSIQSCPFPFQTASPGSGVAYAHAPYGKYEVREKIPNMLHHTNNWGVGPIAFEWDLDERNNDVMGIADPGWGHAFTFGPCHGFFKIRGAPYNDTLFISHDDTGWYSATQPTGPPYILVIDNIAYQVEYWHYTKDTFVAIPGVPFPSSLANSSQTFTFYYRRWNWLSSDSVKWHVTAASDGKYRIFSAPFHIRGGDSILFTKNYQPVALKLKGYDKEGVLDSQITHACHWVASLNQPNKGIIYLDDPIVSPDPDTATEQFVWGLLDQYQGASYPMPQVLVGADTTDPATPGDSAAFVAQPYRYHTYAMEFLPHEVRLLYDSIVIRRWPDRLTPPGSPYFDWVSTMARGGVNIIPGEFDGDDAVGNGGWYAPFQRAYFEAHPHNPGFWDVNGQHAAHHLIDYVKVWDVPKNVVIPGFPQ